MPSRCVALCTNIPEIYFADVGLHSGLLPLQGILFTNYLSRRVFRWRPTLSSPLVASENVQQLLMDGASLMFKTQESEEPQKLDRKLQLASMELVHHGPGV